MAPHYPNQSYWDTCFDEDDEFFDQSPKARCSDRRRTPGKYSPLIRVLANQLSLPLSVGAVYENWREPGKIATLQLNKYSRLTEGQDSETLLAAYRFGLKMISQTEGADFRDAVVDAFAEMLDYGSYYGSLFAFTAFFKAIANVPNSSLERLVVFYTALTTEVAYFDAHLPEDKHFRYRVRQQVKEFPQGVRYYDIWDEFMLKDRCRFHEHAMGRCWRPEESGPEVSPLEGLDLPVPDWEVKKPEVVDLSEVEWFQI